MSAIFGQGKGTVFAKMKKDAAVHQHCMILQSETAKADAVCLSGICLMVGFYGAKGSDLLAGLRYAVVCSTSVSHRFMPERLPPSEDAAKLLAKHAYLQVFVWDTSDNSNLVAKNWA
jgi:hypothetical protein